jgi:hypothetical protein
MQVNIAPCCSGTTDSTLTMYLHTSVPCNTALNTYCCGKESTSDKQVCNVCFFCPCCAAAA